MLNRVGIWAQRHVSKEVQEVTAYASASEVRVQECGVLGRGRPVSCLSFYPESTPPGLSQGRHPAIVRCVREGLNFSMSLFMGPPLSLIIPNRTTALFMVLKGLSGLPECRCLHACSVAQFCLTLCDPMDCTPPCSSVYGILQARILEWVLSPGDLPSPGIESVSSALAGRFFTTEPPGKPAQMHTVTPKHARNNASLKNSIPIRAFLKGWPKAIPPALPPLMGKN